MYVSFHAIFHSNKSMNSRFGERNIYRSILHDMKKQQQAYTWALFTYSVRLDLSSPNLRHASCSLSLSRSRIILSRRSQSKASHPSHNNMFLILRERNNDQYFMLELINSLALRRFLLISPSFLLFIINGGDENMNACLTCVRHAQTLIRIFWISSFSCFCSSPYLSLLFLFWGLILIFPFTFSLGKVWF